MSEVQQSPTLEGKIAILSGFAFSSNGFNQVEGLPLIRIRDLGGSTTEVRFRGRYDDAYRVAKGDLLIGMDGDFEVHRWSGDEALLNQRVCKILTVSRSIDQNFLYWYLKPEIAEIHRKTPQTTVRHLSTKDVYSIEEPSIGVNEQKIVAEILDALDTAIRETEAIIAKLKAVKQGLLHDLLTRGIAANGELRPPQAEAPQLYKQSPLGWIPKEWDVDTLIKACSLIRDGTHLPPVRVSIGPLLLSVRNMIDGKFVLTDQDTRVSESFYTQMHKHWVIEQGDVLLAIVGATIGKIAMVGDMPKFTLQRSVAVLRGKEGRLRNHFMFAYMGSPEFQTALWAQVNQTAQPGIYLDQLGSISIPLPSDIEQQEISVRLSASECKITYEEAALEKLKMQKIGLMDDLLTGRVRVTPLLAKEEAAHG